MRLVLTSLLIILVATVAMADKIPFRTCDPCVGVVGVLSPTMDWQVHSATYMGDDNDAYFFCAVEGGTYTFTFCENGGYADWDTALSIQGPDACGEYLYCNDDWCGLQSEIVWVAPAAGEYILSVDGYSSYSGPYDLAYMGMPCVTPAEETSWTTVKSIY